MSLNMMLRSSGVWHPTSVMTSTSPSITSGQNMKKSSSLAGLTSATNPLVSAHTLKMSSMDSGESLKDQGI